MKDTDNWPLGNQRLFHHQGMTEPLQLNLQQLWTYFVVNHNDLYHLGRTDHILFPQFALELTEQNPCRRYNDFHHHTYNNQLIIIEIL